MMWRLVAVAACVLAVGADATHTKGSCGPWQDIRKRTYGGEEVDISLFPWQVAVLFDGGYVCGGSIISPGWVLTAAHCFIHPDSVERYKVRAGSSKWKEGGKEYKSGALIIHRSYNMVTLDYDIALIKIDVPIQMDDNVKVVTLATSEPEAGTSMKVSGWGESSLNELSVVLHAVTVEVMERSACNSTFPVGRITQRMICTLAEHTGKGPCSGDSGGPLVAGNTQYGVVSTAPCGKMGIHATYTSVSALRSWIKDITDV